MAGLSVRAPEMFTPFNLAITASNFTWRNNNMALSNNQNAFFG